jgi:C4-dicarboxylate-specific signal transduction histidine kinase
MGLLSCLLMLPVSAPVAGSLWVARQIAESVEHERNSPAALRSALRQAEASLLAGDLTEEEYEVIETDLLVRLRAAG